jgi:hypothetical protein
MGLILRREDCHGVLSRTWVAHGLIYKHSTGVRFGRRAIEDDVIAIPKHENTAMNDLMEMV